MSFLVHAIDGNVLWFACVLLYIVDAGVLIDTHDTMVYLGKNGLTGSQNDCPFEFRRKFLYFPNVFRPYKVFFVGRSRDAHQSLTRTEFRLRKVESYLLPLRFLSAFAFLNLFIWTPAMTYMLGLEKSLVVFFANHLLVACASSVFVFRLKPLFRSNLPTRLESCFEMIVFPPNLPNALKRTVRWIEVDVSELVLDACDHTVEVACT